MFCGWNALYIGRFISSDHGKKTELFYSDYHVYIWYYGDISRLMNEPDSETEESNVSSLLCSDSDYSGDTEIVGSLAISDVLTVEDWQTDVKELGSIDFFYDSGLKIIDSYLLKKLIFTDELIGIIAEMNKYLRNAFDKKYLNHVHQVHKPEII